MTPEEWRRIKAVAVDAWQQPDADREAYAVQACAGDESLRAEVLVLLQSMSDAAELFETSPAMSRS